MNTKVITEDEALVSGYQVAYASHEKREARDLEEAGFEPFTALSIVHVNPLDPKQARLEIITGYRRLVKMGLHEREAANNKLQKAAQDLTQ